MRGNSLCKRERREALDVDEQDSLLCQLISETSRTQSSRPATPSLLICDQTSEHSSVSGVSAGYQCIQTVASSGDESLSGDPSSATQFAAIVAPHKRRIVDVQQPQPPLITVLNSVEFPPA